MDNEHRLLSGLTAEETRQLESLLTKWLGQFELRHEDKPTTEGRVG
jgi:hypothetical protein